MFGINVLKDLGTKLMDAAAEPKMFDGAKFVESLKYMGIGMLGIFVVIGIIIGAIALLQWLSSGKKSKEGDSEKAE